ncbi:germinal-center associated nuclear protein [Dromiciops gliroides]|uniref:germinal-center associated nuclear protein n=1 Tax=Dromiciops gliroides TaxID=33562 RepID=UPI001CC474F2|nr:germinal-center associated nuclear protein [Dromiciops gliroides]XP_043858361.1 germinal-center associated nuclear protein [Dromiciops gliroides]XP_043858362.1 germinal-center associated nuclear protein [Dromiciops gliroides]XP_043858363.1 germinal-center associated nuclear protein [Dromiciops gliroides]XP_043858364.1 germinal-center associated nuclear protein [Dromiciops gliroides]
MNPSNPFGGQQSSLFSNPASGSLGTFQVQPPFRFGQPSLFGKSNVGAGQSAGFSQSSSFSRTSGLGHSSSGPVLGFAPTSSMGLFSAHAPGQAAAPTVTSGPPSLSVPSNSGFNFKTPTSSTAFASTPSFGLSSGEASGRSLGRSNFSFKPPENATFRPIFGAESEVEKTQGQLKPGSFAFSHPVSSGSEAVASFTFSQGSSSSGTGQGFAFSKPAGNTLLSTFASAPSTQNVEEDKRGLKPAFGSSGSSFTSFVSPGSVGEPFSVSKAAAGKQGRDDAGGQGGSLPGHAKGLKRKEDHDRSPRRRDYDAPDDTELLSRGDHPPEKRPPRLARPRGGGLFGRTLQDMLRSNKEGGRLGGKDVKKEVSGLESLESEHPTAAGAPPPVLSIPRLKEEEMAGKDSPEVSTSRASPSCGGKESVDSSGSLSQSELTAIQCKNVPNYLNDRAILEKHFGRFGKVQRVYPRRNRKLAIVHFFDHVSAALARKKGKGLHKDVLIFWHKKKTSPSKKDFSPKEKKSSEGEASQSCEDPPFQRSPLRKPLLRPATLGGGGLLSKSSPVKKSNLAKSLQFEGEPFDSGPEVQSSDTVGLSATTLSTLVGTVAETSEDKYRLLDQRDKIMRQARVKRTDLDKAKAFVGTCPDMCPEKERYMRETRNQLSSFEVIAGTDQVDHAAAIKEYSRSSADQEEPLPHELRPSGVLSMTMDYLVTQIMDQREGNSRDWYDFVWNRTRGIRKDITQQHLCDPLTVSLIEKCTRFHIHCAHSLCEEPMSSFDAKINNENMTKCLQSLKEMYQDLANKGVLCASEAEFRGYNVLLNLNKGDILREVQQFRPAVRNSPEVKFAVQAFAALNSNNFVRFFKMVRSASYLNACLLHCYFNQIRKDALRALNVAYTVSTQRSTSFPLDNLVPMLLFRDAEEATDFLSYYGLSVSDGCVELNRSAFLEPEGLSKAKKCTFITEKLTVSVGEVVNGGPLPSVPCHIPVCSFNMQHKYVGESTGPEPAPSGQKPSVESAGGAKGEEASPATEASTLRVPPQPLLITPAQPLQTQTAGLPAALVASAPAPPSAAPSSLFQSVSQPDLPPPKPRPTYSDADIAGVVEELVQDVLRKYCEEISRAGAAYAAAALRFSKVATEELLATATVDILRQVATEEVNKERARIREEEKRVEEQRRRRERERLLAQLSHVLVAELMDLMVAECVREIASRQLKSAVEAERRARVARCSEDVWDRLMDTFLAEEIFQSARETLQELQCFCKYLQRWREAVAARKKLKRQMRAFPAAPCCVDLSNRLQALSPSAECPIAKENLAKGVLNLGHAGKLGVSCTRLRWMRNKTIHQMKVQYFYQQLLSEAVWTPLDLPALIAEYHPGQREQVFWKLVLMLPDSKEPASGYSSRILVDWLKVKFMACEDVQNGACHSSEGIQTLTLLNTYGTKGNRTVWVNVCIKAAHGLLSDSALDATQMQKDLLGTSGLLLLLPAPGESVDTAEEDTYWLSALLQLKQLLQAKPFHPLVPLVVLVPRQEGATAREVEEGLMLQDLVLSQLISDYIVVEIPAAVNDLQGTNRVSQAVKWLLSHCPSSLELCCQTLPQFIEDGVSREFSDRFFYDRKERRVAGLASQEPGAIIDLFNSVLQFLADVASSEQLCHLSWPITEFAEPGGSKVLPHLQWNAPSHLAWLKKTMLSFQLPHMDLPPKGAPWRLVCTMISQYVSQIPSCCQTQPLLQSQVENLLGRTYGKWRNRDLWAWGETGPSVEEIPWDDIIALCVNHKLRDWKPPRLPVTSEALSKDGEICVYFFKSHLKSYKVPGSWEHARLRTQKDTQRCGLGRLGMKPSRSPAKGSSLWLHAPYSSTRGSESGPVSRVPDAEELTRTASAEELLPGRLSASLHLEKAESGRFEDQLRQWLAEDLEQGPDASPLPLYLPQALVSMPQTLQPVPRVAPAANPQDEKAADRRQPFSETDASLADKLKHLESLIRRTREEELVCERHLITLLDMADV